MAKEYTVRETVIILREVTGRPWNYSNVLYLIQRKKIKARKRGWLWFIPQSEIEKIEAREKAECSASGESRRS